MSEEDLKEIARSMGKNDVDEYKQNGKKSFKKLRDWIYDNQPDL